MTMIWIILVVAVMLFLLDKGLMRHFKNQKMPHRNTPENFGIRFEKVRFPTGNKRSLYGWWIPGDNAEKATPTLLLVHGWGRNVERCLPYIRHLHSVGYNLLAFDSRNHGSSDKDSFSSMLKFSQDIQAAIDYLKEHKKESADAVGVIGLSIGGAAAVYATAHDERINCAATVGAFAHPGDIMRSELKSKRLPSIMIAFLFRYVEHKIGARLDAIAPENNIGSASAPIFLIHGEHDATVPVEHGERLLHAGNPDNIDLWIVPGKRHSDCHLHAEFWPRLDEFLRRAFAETSAVVKKQGS